MTSKNHGVIISQNYINDYEYYHNLLKQNPLFEERDWENAYNNNSLPQLISMMTDENAPNLNTLENTYGYSFLDSERRQIALYNELYPNTTDTIKVKENAIDETGTQYEQEVEISEYEYTKRLLQEARDIELEQLKLDEDIRAKQDANFFVKLLATSAAPILDLSSGIVNTISGLGNLSESLINASAAAIKGENFLGVFRQSMNNDKFELSDQYAEWLIDWERKNTFMRDAYGNQNFVGRIVGSAATSIGEMLPTLALSYVSSGIVGNLSKAGKISADTAAAVSKNIGNAAHAIYYTSMTSNNFKQMSLEMPTVPTMKLVLNSAAKTTAEVVIEDLLQNVFGPSNLDAMHFNYTPSGTPKYVSNAVLAEFSKDFIQEGIEEALQEFSGYIVDEAFSLWDEKFGENEFSMQSLVDAFIIGGLTTIATNSASVISTKRVLVSDVSYDENGNVVTTKSGKNIPTKLTKGQSWIYNKTLSEAFEIYDKLINDNTLTLDQRSAALGQLYVSHKTIASFFGSIGEERSKTALAMLDEIYRRNTRFASQKYTKFTGEVVENVHDVRKPLVAADQEYSDITHDDITAVANILGLELFDDKRDLSIKAEYAAELKRTTGATKISKVVHKGDDAAVLNTESEKTKKTVKSLFKLNPKAKAVVITEDGKLPANVKDTEVIPKEYIETSDPLVIQKTIAEQTLQNMLLSEDVFKPMIEEFKSIYLSVKGLKKATDEEVILHTLFDDAFYRILVYRANVNTIKFLGNIVRIVDKIQVSNGADAIFVKVAYDTVASIKNTLKEYCINNRYVNIYDITVFDNRDRLEIKNKRYSKDLANTIELTSFNYNKFVSTEDGKEAIEMLNNKIANAPITDAEKNDLTTRLKSTNSRERMSVLVELDEYYEDVYLGPYNNTTYKREVWLGDSILNNFLIDSGLTLSNWNDINSYSDENKKDIADNNLFDYINDKFKMYTNNKYGLTVKDDLLEVISLEQINMSDSIAQSVTKKLPNIKAADITLFDDVLKDMPAALKNYISLKDLIVNANKYLDLDKLKKYGKVDTPLNIYKSLSKYLESSTNGKYGMTISANNEIVLLHYEYGNEIFVKGVDRKIVNLVLNHNKNDVLEITDLFKGIYLTDKISSIKIYTDGTDKTSYGYYDDVNNIIVLNIQPIIDDLQSKLKGDDTGIRVSDKLLKELKTTLLHEFHHAVFIENGLGKGFGLVELSKDVQKDILKNVQGLDVELNNLKELYAKKYSKNLSKDELLSMWLYDRVNGELHAEGKVLHASPFVVNSNDEVITPYGSIYYLDGDKLKLTNSGSKGIGSYRRKSEDEINKIKSTKAKNRDRSGYKKLGEYDKTRRVSAKEAKSNPKLEPYVDRQISSNLRYIISNFDVAKVDSGHKGRAGRQLENLIKSGDASRLEVFNVLRDNRRQDVDDYTFKIINDAYFGNPNIRTMDQLAVLSDRLLVELWALGNTLKYFDSQAGTNLSKDLTKKMSVNDMMSYINKITSNPRTNDIYTYYLEHAQIVFDPTTKRDYAIEIDDANLRIITLHTFDGTIEGAMHALNRARFIGSRNYKTPKTRSTLSFSTETNDGETTLEDIIGDKNAAEGYGTLIAKRDKMESDLRTFYLERYYNEHPDASYTDTTQYLSTKSEELADMTDDDLVNLWRNMIMSEYEGEYATDTALKYKLDVRKPSKIRANINSIKNKILDRINLTTKSTKKKFLKLHNKYFKLDSNGNVVFKDNILRTAPDEDNKTYPIGLRLDQLANIETDLQTTWSMLNAKDYITNNINRDSKEKISSLKETIAKQKEEIKSLKTEIKNLKKVKLGHVVVSYSSDETFNSKMPAVLEQILSYSFTEFTESKVKLASKFDSENMVINGKKFFEDNGEIFSQLTSDEISEIIDFYKHTSFNDTEVDTNTVRKYEAFEAYVLGYFMEMHNKANSGIRLTDEQVNDIQYILQKKMRVYATGMSIVQSILRKIDPSQHISAKIKRLLDVELTDAESKFLTNKIVTTDFTDKESVNSLMTLFDSYYLKAAKRSNKLTFWDRAWRFQRMCMLSSPATWFKNITSNTVVKYTNMLSENLGDLFTKQSKHSKHIEGQWKIRGVEVNKVTNTFVDSVFINSGLLDILSIGTKYDVKNKQQASADAISSMIVSSLHAKLFTDSQFSLEIFNNAANFIYKMLDDSKWVKETAIKYFKSMLQQRADEKYAKYIEAKSELTAKIDEIDVSENLKKSNPKQYAKNVMKVTHIKADIDKLTREYEADYNSLYSTTELSVEMLSIFSEAYTFASYEYMHRSNAWSKVESTLRKRFGSAGYFMYKQLLPFASSSWNWFVESLKYNPIALIKAIVDFNRIEKRINEVKSAYEEGNAQFSPAFVQFLNKKDIGKGVIGTFGCIVGLLLALFGIATIDEEDYDKIKIKIGDYYIDISDIYGTNSIFFGIVLFNSIANVKNENYDWLDVIADSLDQMFMDSTFADLFNLFRDNDGVGDILVNQVSKSLSMAWPNFIKTILSLTYTRKAQYNTGWLGMVERLADDIVAPIAYMYPSRYDPYTGERQSKYKLPFINDLINKISPVKISQYNVSDIEKTALLYGVRKGELTGRYSDVGNLDAKYVSQLNEYYGKLNAEELQKFFDNRSVYKVYDEKSKMYKTLRYNAMTDEQKKSVIERIMNDNAKYAKMYILTSNGYRYYGSESEINYAKKLGIKNVYVKGKHEGYVLY